MEKEEKSKETKPQNGSPHFQEFLKVFEETKGIEEKVMHGLEFMKKALSFTGGMTFKDFWDAKKLCGPLFKEKMNPIKRNVLWSEYAELGDEARRIKEVKDEQAAFSIEQIEIAIAALEGEIAQHDHLVSQAPKIKFPKGIEKLGIDHKHYRSVQEQLQLLKTLISRLDGLRKEILAIDMRISHKSKLLRRLSKLGDEVFPKRKELIKSVSETFVKDVEFFAKRRFPEGDEKLPAPYYVIRDEIKCFQGLAKVVTLNTQAFNQSRKILSNYWDKIQVKAEEKRSEMEERIEKQNENYAALQPKIEAFETFCQQNENHTKGKILEASDALYQEMKEVDLGRDHVRELKDKIQAAQKGALQHVDAAHQKKKAAAHQKIDDVMQRLIALIEGEKKASLEELQSGEKALKAEYETLSLKGFETHRFERNFADLRSFILEKKEDGAQKEELEDLYEERASHVEVIKQQVEEFRKELGGSSLDFEKAMAYRELYDSAKMHLDREVEALEHLEEKLI